MPILQEASRVIQASSWTWGRVDPIRFACRGEMVRPIHSASSEQAAMQVRSPYATDVKSDTRGNDAAYLRLVYARRHCSSCVCLWSLGPPTVAEPGRRDGVPPSTLATPDSTAGPTPPDVFAHRGLPGAPGLRRLPSRAIPGLAEQPPRSEYGPRGAGTARRPA